MFCVVERDLARHLREIDNEIDVPDADEECIAQLIEVFSVTEREATSAYYRHQKSFEAAAEYLEQYTADPY